MQTTQHITMLNKTILSSLVVVSILQTVVEGFTAQHQQRRTSTTAFNRQQIQYPSTINTNIHSFNSNPRSTTTTSKLYNSIIDDTTKKDDEIERLRTMAAKLRAEAAMLEAQQIKTMSDVVERAFNKFDINQDGVISIEELKLGLEKELKLELTDKRVQQLLVDFDKTGDGTYLQKNDFVTIDKFRNRLDQLARDEKAAAIAAEKAAQREEEVSKFLEAQISLINDRPPTIQEKFISILPYLFPLLDGIQFGKYLILDNPENPLAVTAAVVYALYRSIPFGGLIAFFALNFLSNNPSLNRLIRYNMQQAIFIDIALFFPGLIGALVSIIGGTNIPVGFEVLGNDLLFGSLLVMVSYAILSSLLGITPNRIPLISSSVDARMPPSLDMFDDQGRLKSSKKDEEEK